MAPIFLPLLSAFLIHAVYSADVTYVATGGSCKDYLNLRECFANHTLDIQQKIFGVSPILKCDTVIGKAGKLTLGGQETKNYMEKATWENETVQVTSCPIVEFDHAMAEYTFSDEIDREFHPSTRGLDLTCLGKLRNVNSQLTLRMAVDVLAPKPEPREESAPASEPEPVVTPLLKEDAKSQEGGPAAPEPNGFSVDSKEEEKCMEGKVCIDRIVVVMTVSFGFLSIFLMVFFYWDILWTRCADRHLMPDALSVVLVSKKEKFENLKNEKREHKLTVM